MKLSNKARQTVPLSYYGTDNRNNSISNIGHKCPISIVFPHEVGYLEYRTLHFCKFKSFKAKSLMCYRIKRIGFYNSNSRIRSILQRARKRCVGLSRRIN